MLGGLQARLFQFTPLREGRRWEPPKTSEKGEHFNSRPSARGDLAKSGEKKASHGISIHAPPRGATRQASLARATWQISIHAPPRGATASSSAFSDSLNLFQFTPLREGRRYQGTYSYGHGNFNSRPSARGDRLFRYAGTAAEHFNSRPSARGDATGYIGQGDKSISIHAPPRGATKRCYMANMAWIFQFTPLREGRQRRSPNRHSSTPISIHAPPRGATFSRRERYASLSHFNSRPSARGDDTLAAWLWG